MRLNRQGWDHVVAVVNNRLIFRFATEARDISLLQREIKLVQSIQPHISIPLPNYLYIPDNFSFGGYAMLPGRQMYSYLLRGISLAHKTKIAKQLARFLSELHKIPLKKAQKYVVHPSLRSWWHPELARQRLIKMRRTIFKKLNRREIDWIEHVHKWYFALHHPKIQVLLHGDLAPDHILFNPEESKKITGIIDFGDSEIGDPAQDFNCLWSYGKQFVEIVYANYSGPKDKDFLARSYFPHLMRPAQHMLEVIEQITHPISFEKSRAQLRRNMQWRIPF